MTDKKYKDDRERLETLAPVATANIEHHVFVCNGKSCTKAGSGSVKEAFETELQARKLRYGKESKGRNPAGTIVLTDCGSVGFCSVGPAVLIYPDNVWYAKVTAADVSEIIDEHLEKGKVVKRLALTDRSKPAA